MLKSPPANKPTPVVPSRLSVLQPLQRTTQPTRVLQPSREPLQLSFQFHR